jgi:hypothetical protein
MGFVNLSQTLFFYFTPDAMNLQYLFLLLLIMAEIEWAHLKKRVYYEDGSLRDIYVQDVDEKDWRVWIDFVNDHHDVSFKIYEGEVVAPKIDFNTVLRFWYGNPDSSAMASVSLGRTVVNTFFFDSREIDNDLSPREFFVNRRPLYFDGLSQVNFNYSSKENYRYT